MFQVGLAAPPLRGLLFAWTLDPGLVVLVHGLDGVAMAVLFVLTPVITAHLTARTDTFNLG